MKISMFIILLSTSFSSALSQNGYIEDFKKKWNNAAKYTLEVAELMPENKYDYRPTPEQRTFKDQLLHIVGNMTWLSHAHLGGKKLGNELNEEGYSKSDVIEILKEGFALSSEAIGNLDLVDLEDEVDFFIKPMNKRQILTLMNDHLTHHRGQIIVYLRLQRIKPPNYKGW